MFGRRKIKELENWLIDELAKSFIAKDKIIILEKELEVLSLTNRSAKERIVYLEKENAELRNKLSKKKVAGTTFTLLIDDHISWEEMDMLMNESVPKDTKEAIVEVIKLRRKPNNAKKK